MAGCTEIRCRPVALLLALLPGRPGQNTCLEGRERQCGELLCRKSAQLAGCNDALG